MVHWANVRCRPIGDIASLLDQLGRAGEHCGWMLMSRALAILRLIENRNFVGCSTGRLAGLAPLRIFFNNRAAASVWSEL
jgi:hypothetical protein